MTGLCNFATHRKVEIKVEEIKVNPLKASKRAGR
ncbi:MAG: PxxKW family cysteine-rich protein, partial [Desulfuromonadales bacterium]|nr:PxxKW family cysteine-rich protein [Desulfuromonadales bacterium]